jgi:hypothetical protein
MKVFIGALFVIIQFSSFSQIKFFRTIHEFEGVIVYKNEVIVSKDKPKNDEKQYFPDPMDSLKYYYKDGNFKLIGYQNNETEYYAFFCYDTKKAYCLNATNDTLICLKDESSRPVNYNFKELELKGNISPPNLKCLYKDDEYPRMEIYYDPKIYINSHRFGRNALARFLFLDYTNSLFLKLAYDTGYYKEITTAVRIEKGPVSDDEFKLLDLPIINR